MKAVLILITVAIIILLIAVVITYFRFQKGDSELLNSKNKDNASGSREPRAKRIGKTILTLLAIWGVLLSSWVVFNPRVFVQPGVVLDPNNPAFTPFIIHNQGYLAIYDVKVKNSFKYLKLQGDITVVGLGDYSNRFSDPKHVASVIAPGEQYSVLLSLSGMKHNKIENADIAILLTFKPKWLPWRRETKHRFVSSQSKDGQWYWFPQPINK